MSEKKNKARRVIQRVYSRPVGTLIEPRHGRPLLKVVPGKRCDRCWYRKHGCTPLSLPERGYCMAQNRPDHTAVQFVRAGYLALAIAWIKASIRKRRSERRSK